MSNIEYRNDGSVTGASVALSRKVKRRLAIVPPWIAIMPKPLRTPLQPLKRGWRFAGGGVMEPLARVITTSKDWPLYEPTLAKRSSGGDSTSGPTPPRFSTAAWPWRRTGKDPL